MDHKQQRAVLIAHFQELLRDRKLRLDESGPIKGLDRDAIEATAAIHSQDLADDEALLPDHDREALSRFIRHHDLPVELEASPAFLRAFKHAHRDYCRSVLAYSDSLETFDFDIPATTPAVPHAKANHKRGMSLKQAAKLYRDECMLTGEWTERTQNEKLEYLQVLFEMLGDDTAISAVTAEDANRVKTDLQRYPKNRRKLPQTRDLDLQEALLVEGVERLKVPTLNKYMQTYKGMFGWAVRNHHAATNLFDGMIFRQSQKQKDQAKKSPFSPEQVRAIYTRVLSGPIADPKFEYRKWGPLIAMFTGARLNEISQLMLKDIREEEGTPYFDLNEEGDRKSVKSTTAKRKVPMHSRLVTLGLLEHVERLRRRGETKLFPMLKYCATNGWGRTLGRWVNQRLLVEMELKDPRLSFHSFRHTVVTELYRADVEHPMVQSIVGHERDGVTQQTYFSQGYTLRQRADALERLRYDA